MYNELPYSEHIKSVKYFNVIGSQYQDQ